MKYPVALLISGGAILLNSCGNSAPAEPINEENIISRLVENMAIVSSENGQKSTVFVTPLLEQYEFAKVPFEEHRKGIDMTSYNDTTGVVSSHIVADYALHWTERDLWELKGNVVVVGEEGRTLYSQQLMYDRKIKKIYSNVDSKVQEADGVFIGEGFEADDDFKRWTFRRIKGQISVEMDAAERESSDAERSTVSQDDGPPAEPTPPVSPPADTVRISERPASPRESNLRLREEKPQRQLLDGEQSAPVRQ